MADLTKHEVLNVRPFHSKVNNVSLDIQTTTSGILELLGIKADPLQSREHILVSNIIENVWKTLKIRVQRRIFEIQNAGYFKRVVQEIWTALPLHYIQSLYASIPQRIRSVIRTRGQITKY